MLHKPATAATNSNPASRAFYSNTVTAFLGSDPSSVVGQLSSRHVAFHASAEADQIRAWEREIEILTEALAPFAQQGWSILLEVPLLRLGKRLDAVLLGPGLVIVIEFKTGAAAYAAADRLQTERYAQSLRDFHEVSQARRIIPILCAELAPASSLALAFTDKVADLIMTNAVTLGAALSLAETVSDRSAAPIDALAFALSAYRPTPTIVEAAQALYAGHEIADIGRGDAADAELQAAGQRLQKIAADAEAQSEKSSVS